MSDRQKELETFTAQISLLEAYGTGDGVDMEILSTIMDCSDYDGIVPVPDYLRLKMTASQKKKSVLEVTIAVLQKQL